MFNVIFWQKVIYSIIAFCLLGLCLLVHESLFLSAWLLYATTVWLVIAMFFRCKLRKIIALNLFLLLFAESVTVVSGTLASDAIIVFLLMHLWLLILLSSLRHLVRSILTLIYIQDAHKHPDQYIWISNGMVLNTQTEELEADNHLASPIYWEEVY